jgi:hypothetical protein
MAYYQQEPNTGYGGGYQQQPPPPVQYGAYDGTGYAASPTYGDGSYSQPAPPAPPVNFDDILGRTNQPLLGASDSKIFHIERVAGMSKREIYSHKNFDIDTLRDIEGLREMKYEWQFRMETVMGCWVMFNAVSTIMIILTNFKRGVDPKLRDGYGETNFEAYMDAITYFPLVYFLTLVLLFNNFYSEITFYMYLKRGCIIDFPPSANFKELFKRVLSLLFILTTLGYLIAVIVAFIKFEATIGVILIFVNNLLIGIGAAWYRQQSIEGKFVSISNFIQAFPDRDGEYGNMDEQSLHSASQYLMNLSMTEADEPSYSAYMRQFYWRNKNYSAMWKLWHHFMLLVVIGGLAGLCVAYFIVLRGIDLKSLWNNELNPCINVCAEAVSRAVGLNATQCADCFCRCFQGLRQRDDTIFDTCSQHAAVASCPIGGCPSMAFCKLQPYWPK